MGRSQDPATLPRQANCSATHMRREPWPAATGTPDPQPFITCLPPNTAAASTSGNPIGTTKRS
jgi:hypothetical protein